jgi:hypothetical protein
MPPQSHCPSHRRSMRLLRAIPMPMLSPHRAARLHCLSHHLHPIVGSSYRMVCSNVRADCSTAWRASKPRVCASAMDIGDKSRNVLQASPTITVSRRDRQTNALTEQCARDEASLCFPFAALGVGLDAIGASVDNRFCTSLQCVSKPARRSSVHYWSYPAAVGAAGVSSRRTINEIPKMDTRFTVCRRNRG